MTLAQTIFFFLSEAEVKEEQNRGLKRKQETIKKGEAQVYYLQVQENTNHKQGIEA